MSVPEKNQPDWELTLQILSRRLSLALQSALRNNTTAESTSKTRYKKHLYAGAKSQNRNSIKLKSAGHKTGDYDDSAK